MIALLIVLACAWLTTLALFLLALRQLEEERQERTALGIYACRLRDEVKAARRLQPYSGDSKVAATFHDGGSNA